MKRILALLLTVFVVLSAGCNPGLFPQPTPEPTAEPTAAPTPVPTAAPTPTPEPLPTGFPENMSAYTKVRMERAEKTIDDIIAFIRSAPIPSDSEVHPFVPADKRAELTPEAASYYDAMLEACAGLSPLTLKGEDEDIEAALTALLFDHPEVEICFTMEKEGDEWAACYFIPEGRYFKPLKDDDAEGYEKLRTQQEAFDTLSRYVVTRIPEDFSVIDKYRMLALYISAVSEYAYVHGEVPRYATCAYGAIVNGYSICQGYALGFEYLCRLADLDCRRVRNEFNDENMHFWDIVTLDCGTYYVDVTWCDGSVGTYTEPFWLRWFMFTADNHHVANDGTTTTGEPLGLY